MPEPAFAWCRQKKPVGQANLSCGSEGSGGSCTALRAYFRFACVDHGFSQRHLDPPLPSRFTALLRSNASQKTCAPRTAIPSRCARATVATFTDPSARISQHPATGAGRGPGGVNIIHQQYVPASQPGWDEAQKKRLADSAGAGEWSGLPDSPSFARVLVDPFVGRNTHCGWRRRISAMAARAIDSAWLNPRCRCLPGCIGTRIRQHRCRFRESLHDSLPGARLSGCAMGRMPSYLSR